MRMVQLTLTMSLVYRLLLLQEGIEAKQLQICEKMLNANGEMEDRLNAKLDREFSQINAQLGEMNEVLGQILTHLGMPDVTTTTTKTTTTTTWPTTSTTGTTTSTTAITTSIFEETKTGPQCTQDSQAFEYDGKCFWLIMKDSGPTRSYDLTRSWCKDQGGDVGNIYSSEHYDMVENVARSKIVGSNYYFWTNMTYDLDTNDVFLGTSEKAPYVKWYSSSYPTLSSSNIGIKIQFDSSNHGYYNRPRRENSKGVMCEAEME